MKKSTAGASALALATALVMHFEGYRPVAFLDPVSIPTICYGHTESVHTGQIMTQFQCDIMLKADLGMALATVDRLTTACQPDTRRAALASFTYNAGPGSFARSTILKKLNAGDIIGACNELPKWVRAKGRILPGLVKRRAAERDLCMEGT